MSDDTTTTSGKSEGTRRGTPRSPSVIHEGLPTQLPDIDPEETSDWLDSFDGLVDERGRERARYVMLRLLERAREWQVGVPALRSTDYINTIPPEREPWFPGDEDGALVDGLVDSLTDLVGGGVIWLLTPKVGRPNAVNAADIAEAAPIAGLSQTTTVAVSRDWSATRLVAPRTPA